VNTQNTLSPSALEGTLCPIRCAISVCRANCSDDRRSPLVTECKPGHKLCGTSYCIQKHKQCVSGMPGRRSLSLPSVENAATLCPPGLEACYTADKPIQFGQPVGWECVDTGSNVESCGGCIFPVEGQQRGEDCSGLSGVSEVSVSRRTTR
jgi:hypothetical protein